jgi:hypothetical protein
MRAQRSRAPQPRRALGHARGVGTHVRDETHAPSLFPSSMPSYRSWASRMVRLEPKPSFLAASCCSVDVVNGASGFLRRSRRLMSVTSNSLRPLRSARMACAAGLVGDLRLLAIDVMQLGGEAAARPSAGRRRSSSTRRREGADLALALHDEAQRHGLHATGREPLLHGLPEHRAGLVAHQAIEHAARLLRIDLLGVDRAEARARRPSGAPPEPFWRSPSSWSPSFSSPSWRLSSW